MDLGITGRRAAVAAASAGLGLGAGRCCARASTSPSAAATPSGSPPPVAGLEADAQAGATVSGLVGDVATVAGATAFVGRGGWAGSTSW